MLFKRGNKRLVSARQDNARQGKTLGWQNITRLDKTSRSETTKGQSVKDNIRQGNTRKGKWRRRKRIQV